MPSLLFGGPLFLRSRQGSDLVPGDLQKPASEDRPTSGTLAAKMLHDHDQQSVSTTKKRCVEMAENQTGFQFAISHYNLTLKETRRVLSLAPATKMDCVFILLTSFLFLKCSDKTNKFD